MVLETDRDLDQASDIRVADTVVEAGEGDRPRGVDTATNRGADRRTPGGTLARLVRAEFMPFPLMTLGVGGDENTAVADRDETIGHDDLDDLAGEPSADAMGQTSLVDAAVLVDAAGDPWWGLLVCQGLVCSARRSGSGSSLRARRKRLIGGRIRPTGADGGCCSAGPRNRGRPAAPRSFRVASRARRGTRRVGLVEPP